MTVNELHDALNLLPADLLTAADRIRTGKKPKIIPWGRIVSLAACLALVIVCGAVFGHQNTMMKGAMPEAMKQEAAPEEPAAAAPREDGADMAAAEEAAPEQPADVGAPERPYGEEAAGSNAGMEDELSIDHSHSFAQEGEDRNSTAAYCGNTLTTVYLDEMNYTLAGSYSVKITDILIHLNYDPAQVCRCAAEFTVDTETLTGIEVNLTEGFARCEKGQAALTEEQAGILREIIDNLE